MFHLACQMFSQGKLLEGDLEAGGLKYERAISIGDCSCIATAKITGSRAVFAQRERDLVNEIEKRPFDVEIVFLATEPH